MLLRARSICLSACPGPLAMTELKLNIRVCQQQSRLPLKACYRLPALPLVSTSGLCALCCGKVLSMNACPRSWHMSDQAADWHTWSGACDAHLQAQFTRYGTGMLGSTAARDLAQYRWMSYICKKECSIDSHLTSQYVEVQPTCRMPRRSGSLTSWGLQRPLKVTLSPCWASTCSNHRASLLSLGSMRPNCACTFGA